jgi:hypothetical protein
LGWIGNMNIHSIDTLKMHFGIIDFLSFHWSCGTGLLNYLSSSSM